MSIKKAVTATVTNKDSFLKATIGELQKNFVELKEKIGEKKFEKRIKKAAKLLVAGIKDKPVKKSTHPNKKIDSSTKKAAPVSKKITPSKKVPAKVANIK